MIKNDKYTHLEGDWYMNTYSYDDVPGRIMNGARHKHIAPDGGRYYACTGLTGECHACQEPIPDTVRGFEKLVQWER